MRCRCSPGPTHHTHTHTRSASSQPSSSTDHTGWLVTHSDVQTVVAALRKSTETACKLDRSCRQERMLQYDLSAAAQAQHAAAFAKPHALPGMQNVPLVWLMLREA